MEYTYKKDLWETKDHKKIKISDMETSHIENTRLLEQAKKQKEVINRIFNETTETRNIINNNRGDNILTKGCLIHYLGIVEDLLEEVSE